MSVPSISVLLPVHNGAATLEAAAESILTQSERSLELLILDNGSTDATPEITAGLAARDARVRPFRLERPGLVEALNLGAERAFGRYLARMDADDWSHPDRLAEQMRFLDARADVGLVGCQVEYGGDRAANAGYAAYVDWTNSLVHPEAISLARFVESPFAHPSVFFRRELIERHGGWRDGEFPEDYELWLRWLEAGVRMAKVARPLLRWSDPAGRLSRVDGRYSPEAFYRCKAPYLARWLAPALAGRELWVWGAGRLSRQRALLTEEYGHSSGLRIASWIDVAPGRIGQRVGGRPVISYESLPSPGRAFIVSYVGNRGMREDVARHLESRGYRAGADFILAA